MMFLLARLIYITDLFSTILSLSGLESSVPNTTDSFNMWGSISSVKAKSPRKEIILNIDEDKKHGTWSAAMRWGRVFKSYYICDREKII